MHRTQAKRGLFAIIIGLAFLALLGGRRGPAPHAAPESGDGGDGLYADAAERERALRYNRQREWLTLIGMGWGALTSLLMLSRSTF